MICIDGCIKAQVKPTNDLFDCFSYVINLVLNLTTLQNLVSNTLVHTET